MLPTPIAHVVVIVQQHRSFDNLFACSGISGLDVVQTDPVSGTPLAHISLSSNTGDINHFYSTFQAQYASGSMNGFATPIIACVTDAQKYWALSQQYAIADEAFSAQESESFPALQFLISGQNGALAADGLGGFAETAAPGAGCGVTSAGLVVFYTSPYPAAQPTSAPSCRNYPTIMDSSVTWKFYADANNTKNSGTDSILHLYNVQHATVPETQFITDIGGGTLAELTYITPADANSDYPCTGACTDGGPAWVTSVLQAVAKSSFWPKTEVILTWDTWGGWFDHVKPPVGTLPPVCVPAQSLTCNPIEPGFRTPVILISPYARAGFISHTLRTQCAILGHIEYVLSLPTLSACDSYSNLSGGTDTLSDMTNYAQSPQPLIADPASRRWPARGF